MKDNWDIFESFLFLFSVNWKRIQTFNFLSNLITMLPLV